MGGLVSARADAVEKATPAKANGTTNGTTRRGLLKTISPLSRMRRRVVAPAFVQVTLPS
jgi:hypothetical protein